MNKDTYIRMTEPYRSNPVKARRLEFVNHALTAAVYLSYPLMLVYLAVCRPLALTRAILVPLDGFIIVSVFRYMVNRKRPYETFALLPVIPKDTKGKSFPSRHVFSAFVIAATCCYQPGLEAVGGILLFVAAGIAVTRVIAGVHYISDVVAGALLGGLFAIVGFWL